MWIVLYSLRLSYTCLVNRARVGLLVVQLGFGCCPFPTSIAVLAVMWAS